MHKDARDWFLRESQHELCFFVGIGIAQNLSANTSESLPRVIRQLA
jgi:hypothetical protein